MFVTLRFQLNESVCVSNAILYSTLRLNIIGPDVFLLRQSVFSFTDCVLTILFENS